MTIGCSYTASFITEPGILNDSGPWESVLNELRIPAQVALAVGDDQLRPQLPSGTSEELVSLAEPCFQSDPLSRPSFSHLVAQLSSICSKIGKQAPEPQAQASMLTRFMKSRPFS